MEKSEFTFKVLSEIYTRNLEGRGSRLGIGEYIAEAGKMSVFGLVRWDESSSKEGWWLTQEGINTLVEMAL